MRVLFINKFVPPDPAPTAVLIGAVAAMVEQNGGEALFTSSDTGYRGKRPSGWRRWLREGAANLRLLWRGLSCPRPDIIICLTDPPGSLVIAAVVASLRRAQLVHWAMDVYPEVAVALGELRAGSFVHRTVRAAMRWAYDKCTAIACLDDDMVHALGLRSDPRAFISTPWPPPSLALPRAWPVPDQTRVRCLYSGNLGRAHDYETLLRAQRRLEDAHAPFDLVFQGGGPCREAAMEMAADLRLEHCHWLDYVPEEQVIESMLQSHVLIATQKVETRGLLWPSKLAPMLVLPRAIVWVGPTEGAVANLIRQHRGSHGIFVPGNDEQLARWLMDSRETLLQSRSASLEALGHALERLREDSLDVWRVRLDSMVPRSAE